MLALPPGRHAADSRALLSLKPDTLLVTVGELIFYVNGFLLILLPTTRGGADASAAAILSKQTSPVKLSQIQLIHLMFRVIFLNDFMS